MPGPSPTPVASDPTLPSRVDVVVIGGGIIGTSTALELAERGHSVLLAEKGEIGAEQSSRNWGWVRLSLRDPREIPLMIEAIRLWEGLEERTGRKLGYTKCGILFAAAGERSRAGYEDWARHLEPHQIACRVVDGDAFDDLLPGHRIKTSGALYTPVDGRAEPQWAAPAIAEAARESGAHVMTNCAVRSLDVEAGRVTGVFTEKGGVACDSVVLAGGAWSRLFAGNAGIELPQLKVMNTVLRTAPVEGGPETSAWTDDFAIRKRADGGYTIATGEGNVVDIVPDSFRLMRQFLPALRAEWSALQFRLSDRWWTEARMKRRWRHDEVTPFEETRILDPDPHERLRNRSWAAAQKAFPALKGAQVEQSWAGMIDVTPDAVPVISAVDEVPGFYIATGFSGHGFGIGPGAGKLMADLVTGASPVVDPHALRLSRFSDGTPITLMEGF
ncbi:NAD(P)/FAD-dependent oxidoreductase [Marinibacterium profundimaris]|uniref:D-amino acid oxidase n=1 Tax=Marinibacterium profundimaris TaxID=1679460 RepID=A0A225NI31_9RHOB|nr:FAD-binding oxidoreductase [Marinibacterium profundimaris]OWU73270.1 D-amino acid oxidase [Marinibacterium profundimaris]